MMIRSLLSFAALAALTVAAPSPSAGHKWKKCCPENARVRVDFDSMEPADRKAYTDAIKCIYNQPSSLDPVEYPAAINRYLDYAVVHVNRTQQVHISGYFLTWHRYFTHLFEKDLRHTCGYKGPFPYWNFAATANDIHASAVFDGSEYSMSGDGIYNNTGPIPLGPTFAIPHGTGGGCVTQGPFAYLETTLGFVDPSFLLNASLPPDVYSYKPHCLTRDLNQYVSQMYTNMTELTAAVHAPDAASFELALNGIIGSNSLGIHSGAHFSIGGPMDSIHVSPQDPIWYPLHVMIDLVYTSWQINNPAAAAELFGTMTAVNMPPSANVTLDSIEPDWGYFDEREIKVSDLLSTTGGPFCYVYDQVIS